jgi:6-phosphogluconate dehydrogenase
VESRIVSAYKEERVRASKKLKGPKPKITGKPEQVVQWVRDALYADPFLLSK